MLKRETEVARNAALEAGKILTAMFGSINKIVLGTVYSPPLEELFEAV